MSMAKKTSKRKLRRFKLQTNSIILEFCLQFFCFCIPLCLRTKIEGFVLLTLLSNADTRFCGRSALRRLRLWCFPSKRINCGICDIQATISFMNFPVNVRYQTNIYVVFSLVVYLLTVLLHLECSGFSYPPSQSTLL